VNVWENKTKRKETKRGLLKRHVFSKTASRKSNFGIKKKRTANNGAAMGKRASSLE